MPGETAGTTGGHKITKDLQGAAAMAMTTQGAGLAHLLGEVLGIAIGIAIEIKIDGSSRRDQNCDEDRHRRSDRRRGEVSSNESRKSDASLMGSPFVSFSQTRDSVGSQDSDKWSSQYSHSDVSCSSKVF